jgi:hypothetical protein
MLKHARLMRRQKEDVVHCEIELVTHPGVSGRYLVNVRQGHINAQWRETTVTPQPVLLADAQALFQQTLAERLAQGFVDLDATHPPTPVQHIPIERTLSEADRVLLQRLEQGNWKNLAQHQRNRTLWRIGERRLQAAVPTLVDLIERGDAMQDYCIAWAIGRCADAGAAEAMRELHARSPVDGVRRVALRAWLALAGPEARRAHAQSMIASWPTVLQSAWAAEDANAILAMAAPVTGWQGLPFDAWLEQLDQVALSAPLARRILLSVLRTVPLRAGSFRAVRHIYKMAEMRADGAIVALLQRRFEATAHAPERYLHIRRQYVSFAQEAARPDSTVAYGWPTRHYLLRRGWRTLRRLGADADPDFVPMALAVLNAYDDRDAGTPAQRSGRTIDRYGHWPLFNHLLRSHAGLRHSRSGLSWYSVGEPSSDGRRHEAFPDAWDAQPDALLWLMQHSRCDGVHVFAARALRDNQAYCAALPLETLRDLLRAPWTASARFAFDVARMRFEPECPDATWLLLFVQSTLPEAQQYALDCIARDASRYAGATHLIVALLCAPAEAPRRQGWILCQAAVKLAGQPEAIVQALLDWLDACGSDTALLLAAIAADLFWALDHPLHAAAQQASYERLLALLRHPLAPVRALACHWLLLHAEPASSLPPTLLAALLVDPDADVRGMAVRLFGALPDAMLATQRDLIAVFAVAPDAGVRSAIAPVIARLGAADPAFAAALLPALLDGLFRSETGDGMHADLVAWITGALAQTPALADPDLLRRLLAARSKGAQQLGAALIERFDATQFTVGDWAAFGRNQNVSVRRWAYAAFTAYPEHARVELETALRLFDSRFDDSAAFAIDYFGSICTRADWAPLLLVSLCDHAEPAAQRFGRALITSFDLVDILDVMLKLSQHPSPNMQLFVSAWLERTSSGDIDKLRRLEPYFLSVLSQANRGRVARQRVQTFLGAEAMRSEEIGAFVARLFARQVVTMAIGDKARYIEALRVIQQRYPYLPAVMTIQPPDHPHP